MSERRGCFNVFLILSFNSICYASTAVPIDVDIYSNKYKWAVTVRRQCWKRKSKTRKFQFQLFYFSSLFFTYLLALPSIFIQSPTPSLQRMSKIEEKKSNKNKVSEVLFVLKMETISICPIIIDVNRLKIHYVANEMRHHTPRKRWHENGSQAANWNDALFRRLIKRIEAKVVLIKFNTITDTAIDSCTHTKRKHTEGHLHLSLFIRCKTNCSLSKLLLLLLPLNLAVIHLWTMTSNLLPKTMNVFLVIFPYGCVFVWTLSLRPLLCAKLRTSHTVRPLLCEKRNLLFFSILIIIIIK